ncbi:fructuronate reductase [Okibacterium sp. HSC-33S16]|uniref:mannitol dehydrogenase family protein n=1 Tax=Okibacterium sp. HSC-33S16 TaxID=2910965 RepID=UPI0020A057AD|nr:mannitol dehydrogenase family protein [Okibacterium sp. HSC-33S16]MCP2030267.1 fructuronate reductase [Okibacterium sp. HSC-33S16]
MTNTASAPRPLNRSTFANSNRADASRGIRIVHVGLGAFSRAHQAWYTEVVDETGEWGIAAFTGRNATAANELAPQDGLFTLIERSAAGDSATIVSSIVEAVDGANLNRFVELLAAAPTALVTLTVTEAGYRLTANGEPNRDDAAVNHDIDWLSSALGDNLDESFDGGPVTTLGRLVLGLHVRRLAGAGPLAIVPCDNMPDNGPFVKSGILALARLANAETASWIAGNVSFVSTSVDRITPKTTAADSETAAALTGFADRAPVVTEPFRDWVLSGDFPAGRPAWEKAGARFVDEIEPFERRKLWLLNGAHSLLAYAGRLRGHETVASAITDAVCLTWVNEYWDAACAHLGEDLDLDAYRAALLDRFENARIEHRLAQIGMEGVTKLRVRAAPIILAERAAGRTGQAPIRAIGSWAALVMSGADLADAAADGIAAALASGGDVLTELVRLIDPRLAEDASVLAGIRSVATESLPTHA